MKRTDLIRHLEKYNCVLLREGAKHTIYRNNVTGAMSAVPRHREIKNSLARKICDDLDIPRT
jgi:hypothetical protein